MPESNQSLSPTCMLDSMLGMKRRSSLAESTAKHEHVSIPRLVSRSEETRGIRCATSGSTCSNNCSSNASTPYRRADTVLFFGILCTLFPIGVLSFQTDRTFARTGHVTKSPLTAKTACGNRARALQMTASQLSDQQPPQPPSPKFRTNNVIGSLLGLALASFVTYDLASSDILADAGMGDLDGKIAALGDSTLATQKILDAALPNSATDVVAVALGEGIGGLVGVGSTLVVTQILRLYRFSAKTSNMPLRAVQEEMLTTQAITEAVAGFDYFLTRAVASPLLISIGLDPLLASIGSVLVASIPYELVKFTERLRRKRRTENELLDELLQEELTRGRRPRSGAGSLFVSTQSKINLWRTSSSSVGNNVASIYKSVDIKELKPAVPATEFDAPELLTDLIKWLEFDVLKTKLSGELLYWNGVPLPSWLESGVFGFMAALSSQLYLDALYQNTNLGPEERSEEARRRSVSELIALYMTRCFGTAALFSTYESFKLPVKLAITGLISGGYEACLGSEYFDLCVENFEEQSQSLAAVADGASIQAEFRALVVAYVSLFQRLFGN